MKTKEWSRRHHDDEIYDEVSIRCVPRYKTSGLSGDEWRVSYVLSLSRKGTVLFERGFTKLEHAVSALPWMLKTALESDEEAGKAWTERIKLDDDACAQVGCGLPATKRVRFKEIFAPNGEGPLPTTQSYVTQFCDRHSTRGDCGREDSDDNYEVISGATKRPLTKDESPSAFGGVIGAGADLSAEIGAIANAKQAR